MCSNNNPTLQSTYEERSRVFDALSGVSPWHRLYRERTETEIEKLLDRLDRRPVDILDAGGGTGLTAQWLVRKGHRVVLVDAVASMLDFAREKAKQDPFEIHHADLADLSFLPPNSFDLIVCTQVLNFCPDLAVVFEALHRVIRPGGMMLADVDTAIRWCILEALDGHIENAIAIINEGRDRDRNIVGADYYFHCKRELFGVIESSGFRVENSWGVEYVAPYVHVFAKSKDFLDPAKLMPQARVFTQDEQLAALRRLENVLAHMKLPEEMAGYLQFVCLKA